MKTKNIFEILIIIFLFIAIVMFIADLFLWSEGCKTCNLYHAGSNFSHGYNGIYGYYNAISKNLARDMQ